VSAAALRGDGGPAREQVDEVYDVRMIIVQYIHIRSRQLIKSIEAEACVLNQYWPFDLHHPTKSSAQILPSTLSAYREFPTVSAALLALSVEISSIVPCSSGRSIAWDCSFTGVEARMACTSASLLALPVMKLSSRGAMLGRTL